ncbi:MAG: hypothetical protein KBG42_04740 [Lachnospiraceae bacterium]|nr:hypothetical protein [Lachnospiraceae bacterium]
MINTTENARDLLESLTDEYISRRGNELILLRRGVITKEKFMADAGEYILSRFDGDVSLRDGLIKEFEEYIFGYSVLTPLIDDPDISDPECGMYRTDLCGNDSFNLRHESTG